MQSYARLMPLASTDPCPLAGLDGIQQLGLELGYEGFNLGFGFQVNRRRKIRRTNDLGGLRRDAFWGRGQNGGSRRGARILDDRWRFWRGLLACLLDDAHRVVKQRTGLLLQVHDLRYAQQPGHFRLQLLQGIQRLVAQIG